MLDDSRLHVSYQYELDTVPTVILADGEGEELERFVGFAKADWQALFERLITVTLSPAPVIHWSNYPEWRPGCGSKSVEPGIAERLAAEMEGSPIRARRIEIGEADDVFEFMFDQGLTDGLPVIPPTPERVMRMLSGTKRDAQEVVAVVPPNLAPVTVEKIAINAVMAGCKPEYMPVVVASVKGLATPEFGLHHVAAALSGPTVMILVNGPIAAKLGINATNNVFGPGVRANATIGRALRLVLLNCLKYRPGVSDRATMGTPGKYTCCIAECEEEHPWEPWHVERGFAPEQSTVTLIAASTMTQIWNYGDHEQLLRSAADALSFLGSIAILGQTPGALIFGGEHAEVLRASDWSKQRIREFVVAHTGRTIADLKRSGRIEGAVVPEDEKTLHYALDTPEDLMLICAGSRIGALSMVLPGFGSSKTAGRSPAVLIEEP